MEKEINTNQKARLAKVGMELLSIAGTTDGINTILKAMHAVEHTNSTTATWPIHSFLFQLSMILSNLEVEMKMAKSSLYEYTGCTYDEQAF